MASSSILPNLFLMISCLLPCVCFSTDTLKQGQSLNSTLTIVSANGVFELGFFSRGQPQKIYLGIWYKKIPTQTVVWTANREYPIRSLSCSLSINREGNLVISDGRGVSLSFTTIAHTNSNTSATLLNSGNLILRDNMGNTNSDVYMWQSFDYPTDTLLPGMKLGYNTSTGHVMSLTSWTTSEDPSPGVFSLSLNSVSELVLNNTKVAGPKGYWNREVSSFFIDFRPSDIFEFVYFDDQYSKYLSYRLYNMSISSRLVVDSSGKVKQFIMMPEGWSLFWEQPRPSCQVYALCGSYSSCNDKLIPNCNCLRGFQPNSLREWRQQVWSAGCVRNAPLQCGSKDRSLPIKNVKLPVNPTFVDASNADQCELECLKNCSCNAYAYSISRGCSLWKGDLVGVEQLESGGYDLFLRVAAAELEKINGDSRNNTTSSLSGTSDTREKVLIIALPIFSSVLIFGFFMYCLWRKKLKQRGKREIGLDLLSFDFSTKTNAVNGELSDKNKNASGEKWEAELPFFNFSSISTATDNFSDANKLGQGGFGLVYKGKLLNGQEVAIKRLSRGSKQGLEELKNEATLIAKLQHRNLVRLLGCCIEDEEKILIYEYMPNKSLDFFIFDHRNKTILDWEKRIFIIEGIAQGLLYLHQHSRLRIIHRDLKASNILLDNQMKAKISDFGMARIFGGNELQGNTGRVVGTYGYMSPEYVMEGLFSIKSDVFSFGVLLIEILSSKRNTGYHIADSLTLLEHAWKLWNNQRGHELIDSTLLDPSSVLKALRCVNVALLCVQELACDRPTMSEVVTMLSNEETTLPSPKQPAFCTRSSIEKSSSLNKLAVPSTNYVTITSINGR
ncbi:hypothetical protein Scep_016656 [Stephania cephalantha]|uniref:Receptor-like serine/threonine-protein kinase n=1 Tax=Stephania cephalantha TaxID=152367 RepID=A0AAP0IPC4_9MAGN